MSKLSSIGHHLYTGEISYDFVGRRRIMYLISAGLIVIVLGSLLVRGLNFGIEFTGGADFRVTMAQTNKAAVASMQQAVADSGVANMDDATVTTLSGNTIRVETRTLDAETEVPKVRAAIAAEAGVNSDQVTYSLIGASWGQQITSKAGLALGVFLILVTLVIWAYFRNWKMSVSALVALLHDLIITVGVYALVGFTVTPATLIGVLTILGYSLYDTVVVFDKVRENVRDLKGSTTKTYSEAANLAVNQTLIRSINTTLIGVLPVAALLFAGAFILGTGPLKDLSLALFIGMISGAYSSIFIATPLLAQMKEREPDMIRLTKRVQNRRAKLAAKAADSGTGEPGSAGPQPKAVETTNAGSPSKGSAPRRATGAQPGQQRGRPAVAVAERDGTTGDGQPEAARPDGTQPTVKVSSTDSRPAGVRPLTDGAAKRPQPRNKPRSQRKK